MSRKSRIFAGFAVGVLFSSLANGTVVQFQTVLGTFEVNLYDESTPATVANFLEYVAAGDYDNVVMHRAVNGFVVQGGGFVYEGTPTLAGVTSRGSVANEPVFSNVRATIAMAKLGGDPDSATSEWYINLADNSANLDLQNGGFTVFGEVTGSGMVDVLDVIDALPRFDFGGAFTSIPLRDYTAQNAADDVEVTDQHLVVVTAIVVLDAAADTAAGLTPVENTLIDPVVNPPPVASGGGGGGGSTNPVLLFLLGVATFCRCRQRTT